MEEAKVILTKYHGGDDPNHPLVLFQIREFEEGIKVEKASAFWDYSGLVSDQDCRLFALTRSLRETKEYYSSTRRLNDNAP